MEYKDEIATFEANIKKRISNYWSGRSHDFAEQRKAERDSHEGQAFLAYIKDELPAEKGLHILDVGCGPGMFALMLAKEGHHAVGIDLTEHMILHARELAEAEGSTASFYCMDGEKPEFHDNTFDVIVTRNLTWTLPHPREAYEQWLRILKPGGLLLNFDADYGHDPCDKDAELLPADHTHRTMPKSICKECESIKSELEISEKIRPGWDVVVMKELGYCDFRVDEDISRWIYKEIGPLYNPTPMFMIAACKAK